MSRKLCLLLPVLLAACADRPVPPDARSFDWLAGCWRLERDGGHYDEMWLPAAAGSSLGTARQVRGGQVVDFEFMRLELRGGSLVFVAHPSGRAAVEFALTEHAPGRLVFENPRHDFPSRIEYRLVNLNAIAARISGTLEGAERAVDYPMQRIACEG